MASPDKWRAAFLAALREAPYVKRAAAKAGIHRNTAYAAAQRDPDFKDEWDEAVQEGVTRGYDVAWDHAVNGWPEPVYQNGKMVGTILKYDHRLLMELMRSHDRDTFGQRQQIDHTGVQPEKVRVAFEWPTQPKPTETD